MVYILDTWDNFSFDLRIVIRQIFMQSFGNKREKKKVTFLRIWEVERRAHGWWTSFM